MDFQVYTQFSMFLFKSLYSIQSTIFIYMTSFIAFLLSARQCSTGNATVDKQSKNPSPYHANISLYILPSRLVNSYPPN